MTLPKSPETITLTEFAQMLGITVGALRVRISNKTVPDPLPRVEPRESKPGKRGGAYYWRTAEVERFLGNELGSDQSELIKQSMREVLKEANLL